MKQFGYSLDFSNGIAFVTLSGELLADNVRELKKELTSLAENAKRVVVDISKLDYICSGGMGVLVSFYNQVVQKENGNVVIIGLNKKIERTFSSAGFTRFMNFADSIEEAVDILSKDK
jgi:fatty-acyl-CoA synthase/long-chain acyl-CoA synthetase